MCLGKVRPEESQTPEKLQNNSKKLQNNSKKLKNVKSLKSNGYVLIWSFL